MEEKKINKISETSEKIGDLLLRKDVCVHDLVALVEKAKAAKIAEQLGRPTLPDALTKKILQVSSDLEPNDFIYLMESMKHDIFTAREHIYARQRLEREQQQALKRMVS